LKSPRRKYESPQLFGLVICTQVCVYLAYNFLFIWTLAQNLISIIEDIVFL